MIVFKHPKTKTTVRSCASEILFFLSALVLLLQPAQLRASNTCGDTFLSDFEKLTSEMALARDEANGLKVMGSSQWEKVERSYLEGVLERILPQGLKARIEKRSVVGSVHSVLVFELSEASKGQLNGVIQKLQSENISFVYSPFTLTPDGFHMDAFFAPNDLTVSVDLMSLLENKVSPLLAHELSHVETFLRARKESTHSLFDFKVFSNSSNFANLKGYRSFYAYDEVRAYTIQLEQQVAELLESLKQRQLPPSLTIERIQFTKDYLIRLSTQMTSMSRAENLKKWIESTPWSRLGKFEFGIDEGILPNVDFSSLSLIEKLRQMAPVYMGINFKDKKTRWGFGKPSPEFYLDIPWTRATAQKIQDIHLDLSSPQAQQRYLKNLLYSELQKEASLYLSELVTFEASFGVQLIEMETLFQKLQIELKKQELVDADKMQSSRLEDALFQTISQLSKQLKRMYDLIEKQANNRR